MFYIYIIIESRLSVCLLSPLKRRDVRRQNFACGRAPCVCRTWDGSYVDRSHRWEENENFAAAAATCCYIIIDLDVGRVAGLRTARRPTGRVAAR